MQLFTELKANIYDRLFRDAPFFRNAPDEFINSIVLALEEMTFSPGEPIIVQGEIGAEMHLFARPQCSFASGERDSEERLDIAACDAEKRSAKGTGSCGAAAT